MSGEGGTHAGTAAKRRTEWLPALLAGALGGAAASTVGVPVPWLVGALIAGLINSVALRKRLSVPDGFQAFAQVTIGLAVGLSFSLETVTALGRHLPAVLLVLMATTAASLANGYLLSRWTQIDRASGLLGSIPGAASAMVAAAHTVGADARAVAVLQYVRLLFILIVVPPLLSLWRAYAHASTTEAPIPVPGSTLAVPAAAGEPASLVTLALVLPGLAALGAAGAFVGTRLRFPSPRVLGPMALAMGVAAAFPDLISAGFHVPGSLFSAALVIIGTSVGLRFDREILGTLRKAAAIELALLVGLLGVSAALADLLHLVTGIDLATAVMGNIPGALEGMVAVSMDLGADAAIVAAMQTTRSVSLLLAGPWIVRGLQAARRKSL